MNNNLIAIACCIVLGGCKSNESTDTLTSSATPPALADSADVKTTTATPTTSTNTVETLVTTTATSAAPLTKTTETTKTTQVLEKSLKK